MYQKYRNFQLWFSSDDERDDDETKPPKEPAGQKNVEKSVKSPTVVEEKFTVHDLLSAWENREHERSDIQPAHSLNSMISRTENAINDVEVTINNAEVNIFHDIKWSKLPKKLPKCYVFRGSRQNVIH